MNQESRQRFREAAEYQKKALQALFPEQMSGHLNVIEQELKAMMLELAMELVKEQAKETKEKPEHAAVKKVEIQ